MSSESHRSPYLASARVAHSFPARAVRAVWREVTWVIRLILSALDRFYWDNGFSKAAGLAYTTLFSLVPMTVLVFGLLGSFAVSTEHLPKVRQFFFNQFIPSTEAADTVTQYLANFSEAMSDLSLIAVAGIVVTSLLLINSIEFALNEVWQVFEPRTIAQRIAIFCAILVIGPILFLSAYYFTKLRVEPLISDLAEVRYLGGAIQHVVPFSIDFLGFLGLYFLVPKAPVKFKSAVCGAFFTAFVLGVAKWGFAVYIELFSSYTRIYTTLAAIPIFLFWLYLFWSIVLLGAELSYQAQYLPRTGKLWKRTLLSVGDGALVLATQALTLIGRAFESGNRLPNDLELSEALGCSTTVLKPTLVALERAGILARGDSSEMPLTLLKSPHRISVGEVRLALFPDGRAIQCAGELSHLFRDCHAGGGAISLEQMMRLPALAIPGLPSGDGAPPVAANSSQGTE